MIKIKFDSKKTITEIKVDSPQYKESSAKTSSDKTVLDNIFKGKKRLVTEFLRKIPSTIYGEDDKELENLMSITDNIVDIALPKVISYATINLAAPNEDEEERREKLRKDPAIALFAPIIQDIINKAGTDQEKQVKEVKNFLKKIVYYYFKNYTDEYGFSFSIDLGIRRVTSRFEKQVKNDKSPTGYSAAPTFSFEQFLDLQIQAHKELEEYAASLKRPDMRASSDLIFYRKLNDLEPLTPSGEKIRSTYNKVNGKQVVSGFDELIYGSPASSPTDKITPLQYLTMFKTIMDKFAYETYSAKNRSIHSMVITRVPLEIVRMSDLRDFPHLKSCHSVGAMFASCATQEAVSSGGAVAFLMKEKFNDAKKKRLEDAEREFLKDSDRELRGSTPISRIRVRSIEITFENEKPIILHIPIGKMYGVAVSNFHPELEKYLKGLQSENINKIRELVSKQTVISGIKIFGGGYFEGDLILAIKSMIDMPTTKLLLGLTGFSDVNPIQREYPSSYVSNINMENVRTEYETEIESYMSENPSPLSDGIGYDITISRAEDDLSVDAPPTGYASGESVPKDRSESISVIVELNANCTELLDAVSEGFKDEYGIPFNMITNRAYPVEVLKKEFKGPIEFTGYSNSLFIKARFDADLEKNKKALHNFIDKFNENLGKFFNAKNYPNYLKMLDEESGESLTERIKYVFRKNMGK